MRLKRYKIALADDPIETPQDIEQVVKQITYKNNATIKTTSVGSRTVTIQLSQTVPDAYRSGVETTVYTTVHCGPDMFKDVRDLLAFIRVSMLHAMELHESDEWFRFNGKMVFDPHVKGAVTNFNIKKLKGEWVRVEV